MKQLLKLYFNFNGRLNRLRYFLYGLPLSIIALLSYAITMSHLAKLPTLDPGIPPNTYIILGIYFFIIAICSISGISLSVRRLHDLNKTGWLVLIQLLSIIPVLNIISLIFNLYVMFAPGINGPNQYGDDPLNY